MGAKVDDMVGSRDDEMKVSKDGARAFNGQRPYAKASKLTITQCLLLLANVNMYFDHGSDVAECFAVGA